MATTFIQNNRQKQPSKGQSFLGGLASALPDALAGLVENKRRGEEQERQENLRQEGINQSREQARALGINENILDPALQKLLAQQQFEQQQPQKNEQDQQMLDQAAGIISNRFGPEAGDLFKALPIGGQTELVKHLLEREQRGQQVKEKVGEEKEYSPFEGMTPKERVQAQSEFRKSNEPIFREAQSKTKAAKSEKASLKILDDLNNSGKLPSGMGSIIIDPHTGGIRPTAQLAGLANPETERFVKTVQDFTTKAKDTFGSRVTNFDLANFMKRLPSLLNTPEGRRQIIRQMEILSDINNQYYKALSDVYKKHKLGNISEEDAAEMAESMIEDREKELLEELNNIRTDQQEEKKEFTKDIARDFLRQANGDKRKAQQLARDAGYEF